MNCNNDSPFFSVVVPVYNGENCIRRCLDSILGQSFENFEIIVVNDGSTDKTPDVLNEIAEKDRRLRVVSVENGGGFRARAKGALLAKGTYVLFCDDDDHYVDDKVFQKLFEIAGSEEYDFIQYGFRKKFNHLSFSENTVKENTVVEREEFYERDYPFLLSSRNISSRLFVSIWGKIYHRRLLKNMPDPEKLERMFMGDDMVLNLYLLKDCNKGLYIPEALYVSLRLAGDTEKYRRNEMHNLDLIKKYQLGFLCDWHGRDYDKVERLHHLECAEWLFLHIKNSLKHLPEDELASLIFEILELPAFIRARSYFKSRKEESLPVELLIAGDPDKYIEEARKHQKGSIKERIYKFLKNKIVYKI